MTLPRAATTSEIVAHLQTLRSDSNVEGMSRFGIATETALGISNPDLQKLAKSIGRDHGRALELWKTGLREARMLAIYTADPKVMTKAEVEDWAADFASWEIVDAAADLLTETPYWRELIKQFAEDDREFVRRTAFSMIAGATVHNKSEPNEALIAYLPLIERHAGDERNFVKKAVNWALRNIGKRNRNCHGPALVLAEKLAASDDRTARWIGKDALRELSSDKILAKLKP
ncbi:DNA alkylation repair protein [Rhizobium sp. S153]|uniref:DNA alkylation repair protein n=1 Tax=Ciceribacter sichuanensis TaxID=2949647 RepID=A0ABT0V7R4_9HYPH|nr:DNA alkylation repair protein [Ciceribacter sp. S153]MCM2401851.1 DNA alkylation repair protein [Ciceribacter sp. S153]